MSTEERRQFLKLTGITVAALATIPSYQWVKSRVQRARKFPGEIKGANASRGYLLRDPALLVPKEERQVDVAIIGGGVSGLSAAWWLHKRGVTDFELFELEDKVGGNSQSGENAYSKYPWGAHYVPLPGPEAKYVRELFEDVGIIQGYDKKTNLPIFNEYHLCADPHERLFMRGRWQDGFVPLLGITADDQKQYEEFFAFVEEIKKVKGRDGKRAFVIPMEESSADPEWRKLDQISMKTFMHSRGWKSRYLSWYVDYSCRDDYGQTIDQVSAWAGLHYYASRVGEGVNADSHTVLTWPEGNGWLVEQLRARVESKIKTGQLVYSVKNVGSKVHVETLDVSTKLATRVIANQAIFTGPRFIASHVVGGLREERPRYLSKLQYAPWAVANITLKSAPEGNGAPLSWDNVRFESEALGYVVANHQELKLFPKETVITYYWPLSHKSPKEARKEAAERSHGQWADLIVKEMSKMHPEIADSILNIDVWVWGHGMISPGLDFIWSKERQEMRKPIGSIHFANTDMSGISIFEEAQYRGVEAAKAVIAERSQVRDRG